MSIINFDNFKTAGKVNFNASATTDYSTNEAFKTLRSNLLFCGKDKNVILVTSALENEGKSTVATELSKKSTGKTVYILDEPTTGLHTADVAKLLEVLSRISDGGNTIICIEHNLDVIKCADYIIDLGPEGGDGGGKIVATGTPEEVAMVKGSYTGQYLERWLSK